MPDAMDVADAVAREKLPQVIKRVTPLRITIARNALLDAFCCAPEPCFIAKVLKHPFYRTEANHVLRPMEDHIVDWAIEVLERLQKAEA
jgi:hypothetical protein